MLWFVELNSLNVSSSHCSGLSNSVNLQSERSRYARLKLDIDKEQDHVAVVRRTTQIYNGQDIRD